MRRLIILISLLLLMTIFFAFGESAAETVNLDPWLKANINWKQFEGQSISVLVLPHAYTLALKSYVPIFEGLTGISVGYEMIGEPEMRRKRQIDLAAKSGLYDVVAIGLHHIGPSAPIFWYRKDLFDKYGIKVPDTYLPKIT